MFRPSQALRIASLVGMDESAIHFWGGTGRVPRESFKVIFYLAGYFYFARLFRETLRKYPLKRA